MRSGAVALLLVCALVAACVGRTPSEERLCGGMATRAPSVPIFVADPYVNFWLGADALTDESVRLWDGTRKSMVGMVSVDGVAYRWLGGGGDFAGAAAPAMKQRGVVEVGATTSTALFDFPDAALADWTLRVRFTTPRVPQSADCDRRRAPDWLCAKTDAQQWMSLASPINVVEVDVLSGSGAPPANVAVYFDASGEVAVNSADQLVDVLPVLQPPGSAVVAAKLGTTAQQVLGQKGDRIGIDWGYAYLAAASADAPQLLVASLDCLRTAFLSSPSADWSTACLCNSSGAYALPAAPDSFLPGMAAVVSSSRARFYFGYDEVMAVQWFGTALPPLWHSAVRTANASDPFVALLEQTLPEQNAVLAACRLFDRRVAAATLQVGGAEYCAMSSLAYRQTLGALKIVKQQEQPWVFLKEISSNGDVNTVDVIFPASPQLLFFCPWLLEALIEPVLVFADNQTSVSYDQVFAPHQLGTYPIAYTTTAQQENMPIEESGNLIINLASLALHYNRTRLLAAYWPLVQQWADYLVTVLPDPGYQLSTDDFEGPSPHNCNLAAKGILALRVFAELARQHGNATQARHFVAVAERYAANWTLSAFTAANRSRPHYKLQYNLPGSWSLKYNVMQQYLFGIDLYPAKDVVDVELAYYLHDQMNRYGLPLDDRATFAKWDWSSWVAAMATSDDHFAAINRALYRYVNETATRVPLSDWYSTTTGLQHLPQHGFQARPVVGAIFAKILRHYPSFQSMSVNHAIHFND